jgi:hypothetical protein
VRDVAAAGLLPAAGHAAAQQAVAVWVGPAVPRPEASAGELARQQAAAVLRPAALPSAGLLSAALLSMVLLSMVLLLAEPLSVVPWAFRPDLALPSARPAP